MSVVDKLVNGVGMVLLVCVALFSICGFSHLINFEYNKHENSEFWQFVNKHTGLMIISFLVVFLLGGTYLSSFFPGNLRQQAYFEKGYNNGYSEGYTDGQEGLMYDDEFSESEASSEDERLASYDLINPYTGKAFQNMQEFWDYCETYKQDMQSVKEGD